MPPRLIITFITLLALSVSVAWAKEVNLAREATVSASSTRGKDLPEKIVDGVVSDQSRWRPEFEDSEPWIELTFPNPVKIGAVDIFSGWKRGSELDDFDLTFESDGKWSSPVRDNSNSRKRLKLDATNVSKLRIAVLNPGVRTIREVAVYEDREPPAYAGLEVDDPARRIDRDVHQIAVNQVGYLPSQPKRFTAPLSRDGTKFVVREEGKSKNLFSGTIQGGIGDFSEFQPTDSSKRYVIKVSGGGLESNTSDPFLIAENLLQDQYWQPAVDFLIDSRSVVGTHPSAYGGCPWRDGSYYDTIIPALVLFYMADPERIEAMPHQVDWQADKERLLSPDFNFDQKNPSSEGAMYAALSYYWLEPPRPDAPDVVKLIHWGAGFYLVNPWTFDPGDPDGRIIHSQTVEQVAYVLWAWPILKQWLPQSFYDQCHDFCFENWERSLAIDEWWNPETYTTEQEVIDKGKDSLRHPYKGRHAPGHSIGPNLLMHEVAKREGRPDADIYLNAALNQADYIVKNLDWNDPRTTKGHRMSEHRTIPNLVWLLQKYPKQAPDGLKEKITEWAKVAISRSDNLWDFRRYDLEDNWTIPDLNDLGNSLGLPAIMMSASSVVDDPKIKQRLKELAFASIDHVFGRNPRLAAAPAHPEMGFPEIEHGWPRPFDDNYCARLELCRGSLSSLPGTEMYPFNEEGVYRHNEGKVHYGAAWCISLAYLHRNEVP